MQKTHEKAIRGISIAVLVLSIISLVTSTLGLLGLLAGASVIDNYNYDLMSYSIPSANDLVATHHGFDDYDYDYYYDFDDDDWVGMGMVGIIFGGMALVWKIITSVITLIAGIKGMRHYNNPEKYKVLFIWFVIGAVASLLGVGIAVMVLLIINAVFVHKDRTLLNSMWQNAPYDTPTQPYNNPYTYGTYNPVEPTSPGGYNAPVYGAPTPVYGQPQTPVNTTPTYGTYPTAQPYAPASGQTYQPVAPVQPVNPYEQTSPYQQTYTEQPYASTSTSIPNTQEAVVEPGPQASYFNVTANEPTPEPASSETPAVELTLDPEGFNTSVPTSEPAATPIELVVESTESTSAQEEPTATVSPEDSNAPTDLGDNGDSAHNDNPYHSSQN